MPDQAYACVHCGLDRPGRQLATIADMTGAARDVAHGFGRRGTGGASGKPGSRLPLDLTATSKLDAVQGSLTTWARHIADERGLELPDALIDPIVAAARFIERNLEWARHRPEVDEMLSDIDRCARVVQSLAKGPAAQRYLGPCGAPLGVLPAPEHYPDDALVTTECGGDVYCREGAQHGACRTCGAEVSTAERQAWLDGEVRSHAFRAAHIAQAYGINVNTIRSWAARGNLPSYWRTSAGLVTPWTDPELDPNLKGEAMNARLGEISDEIEARGGRLHYVGDVLDLAAVDAARRAEEQAKRARRAATRAAGSEGDAA